LSPPPPPTPHRTTTPLPTLAKIALEHSRADGSMWRERCSALQGLVDKLSAVVDRTVVDPATATANQVGASGMTASSPSPSYDPPLLHASGPHVCPCLAPWPSLPVASRVWGFKPAVRPHTVSFVRGYYAQLLAALGVALGLAYIQMDAHYHAPILAYMHSTVEHCALGPCLARGPPPPPPCTCTPW
jgi:hypothetical protein